MSPVIQYTKGHGTKNDFVVIEDLEDKIELTPSQIIQICNRETGIGADGILRITKKGNHFFMDYRNADGSLAEMCGNGARVFAQYLFTKKLVIEKKFTFDTRAGLVQAEINAPGDISVTMDEAILRGKIVEVSVNGHKFSAQAVDAPNPHAVAFVPDLGGLGDLKTPPVVSPGGEFPNGVNVEFVKKITDDHVQMRVHERGSGETLSCGTGACAVAAVLREQSGKKLNNIRIDLPGGTLHISFENGKTIMRGPAILEDSGTLPQGWFSN
jgi:diaminopimelate epimerase